MNTYYVYILASGRNGTLYVGVTNDLIRRVDEHKRGKVGGFTKKYAVNNLVYLKVPHHGSKNGLSQKLLDEVRPQVAVISLGKNSFGHPHEEVLKLLSNSDTKILRTDQIGDVVVETNGSTWWIK